MNTYIAGSLVRTTATFVNVAGTPANPTTTVLKYRAGAGSVQTISSPTNDAPGVFHYDIDTTGWDGPEDLLYSLEWIGTGAVQAITVDWFQVIPPTI
jgi:hypothetical protein